MANIEADVQLAFESFVEKNLQAAVNYAGGNPDIDRIWIYTIFGQSSVNIGVYYRYRGRCCGFGELPLLDPEGDYDFFRLNDEQHTSGWLDLLNILKQFPEMPERIIVTYDPEQGSVESTWDYEGTKENPDDPGWRARDRWIVSLGGKPDFGPVDEN